MEGKSTSRQRVQMLVAAAAIHGWQVTQNHTRLVRYVRWVLNEQLRPLLAGAVPLPAAEDPKAVDEDLLQFDFACAWKALLDDVTAAVEADAPAEYVISTLQGMELFERFTDKQRALSQWAGFLDRENARLQWLHAVILASQSTTVLPSRSNEQTSSEAIGQPAGCVIPTADQAPADHQMIHKRTDSVASSTSPGETASEGPSSANITVDDTEDPSTGRLAEALSRHSRSRVEHGAEMLRDFRCDRGALPSIESREAVLHLMRAIEDIEAALSAVRHEGDGHLNISWFQAASRADTARLCHDRRRQRLRAIPRRDPQKAVMATSENHGRE
jgi:hypothetical protein